MQCLACQHNNSEKAKFCEECGTSLTAANVPSQANRVTIDSGGNTEVGGDFAGRDKITAQSEQGPVIVAGDGSTIVIGEQPIEMTAVKRESALGRYLSHVISRNRYLQLQGIRSGGRLVNIELENIYITLRATRTRTVQDDWTEEDGRRTVDRYARRTTDEARSRVETVTVKVQEALAENLRLVVLGDPGSGKTTLLRYLVLCYARDRAEKKPLCKTRSACWRAVTCRSCSRCVTWARISKRITRRMMAPKATRACSTSCATI